LVPRVVLPPYEELDAEMEDFDVDDFVDDELEYDDGDDADKV
jgi:hypothetical protein